MPLSGIPRPQNIGTPTLFVTTQCVPIFLSLTHLRGSKLGPLSEEKRGLIGMKDLGPSEPLSLTYGSDFTGLKGRRKGKGWVHAKS